MIENFVPKILAKNIAENAVSQWFQFVLLISIFSFRLCAGRPPIFNSSTTNEMRLFVVIQAILFVATALFAYQENGANSGKDFIQRFFLIGCVLYFWVNIISMISYFAVYMTFSAFFGSDSALYYFRPCGGIQYLFMFATSITLMSLVVKYIRITRRFCEEL